MTFRQVEEPITLSAHDEQNIRALGQLYGVDSDFLIRFIQTVQVSESPGGSAGFISDLHASTTEQQRAADLALSILSGAYGDGMEPDFSENVLIDATLNYETSRREIGGWTSPVYIGSQTEAGMRRWAREEGIDGDTAVEAYRIYCTFLRISPEMAERALDRITAGDDRLRSFVMAYGNHSQTEEHPNGRTEYFIWRRDKDDIRREYANRLAAAEEFYTGPIHDVDEIRDALSAVPVRSTPQPTERREEGERILREQIEQWGGNYDRVMDYLARSERGEDVTVSRDQGADVVRDVEITQGILEVMRRNYVRLDNFRNWEDLDWRTRGNILADLGFAYRPEVAIVMPGPELEETRERSPERTLEVIVEVDNRTYAIRYTPREEERTGGLVMEDAVRRDLARAFSERRVTEVREITGDREFEDGDVVSTAEFRRSFLRNWGAVTAIGRNTV
ncbi:hypothetical protein KKB44_01425 [Candidatus Micrarchaeota archaeon]|nr:hypothetical protein [Candidatus Micrarchaeota archaeon]